MAPVSLEDDEAFQRLIVMVGPEEVRNANAARSSDEAIVDRLQHDKTPDVLAQVLALYGMRVREILGARFSHTLDETEIEEILTEALLALWTHRMKINLGTKGSLGGWYYIVSRNIAIDKLKQKSREKTNCSIFLESVSTQAGSTAEDLVDERNPTSGANTLELVSQFRRRSARATVSKLISELNHHDQRIVNGYLRLNGIDSWATQLGKELGIPPNYVRVKWYRIKQKLRRRIEIEEVMPAPISRTKTARLPVDRKQA